MDGTLHVVTGASRMGKTSWVAAEVTGARRLWVWDIVGQWADEYRCRPVYRIADLAQCALPSAPAERIAFQPSDPTANSPQLIREFSAFCRLAYIAMQSHRLHLVVEELADVTSPGKAPPGWGMICRRGLRYGPELYALTQRPAESDKTAMGNASRFHTHAMARADDARYIARELRVDQKEIDGLAPLQWIARDRRTNELRRGDLRRRAHWSDRGPTRKA